MFPRRLPSLFWTLDSQDWASGIEQNPLRVRPEEELAHLGPSTETYHDEVGLRFFSDGDEVLTRVLSPLEHAHFVGDPLGLEGSGDARQLIRQFTRLSRPKIPA